MLTYSLHHEDAPRAVGVDLPPELAVHIGQRVLAEADAGELLLSSIVKDLAAGSGLAFADRGLHRLRGVPEEWRLFEVVSKIAG